MPTVKPRIYISISGDVEKIIAFLAKRDQVPHATKASELLRLGLETEEDQTLDTIAKHRDTKGTRFISHKSAWR